MSNCKIVFLLPPLTCISRHSASVHWSWNFSSAYSQQTYWQRELSAQQLSSHQGHLHGISEYLRWSLSSCASHPGLCGGESWKALGDASRAWIPDTSLGKLRDTLGSWVWPALALVSLSIWVMTLPVEHISFLGVSHCPFKNIYLIHLKYSNKESEREETRGERISSLNCFTTQMVAMARA